MTIIGYARVSTPKQSLVDQIARLQEAHADKIYSETYTGTTSNRPQFRRLQTELHQGDTLMIVKIDRLARNTREALNVIADLMQRGVSLNVLDMGQIFNAGNNSPTSNLLLTVMSAFADLERDLIVSRTQEGKERAKINNPNYREGRPRRKITDRYRAIYDMYQAGDKSARQVAEITGISRATLFRIKKQIEEDDSKKTSNDGEIS